MRVWGLVVL